MISQVAGIMLAISTLAALGACGVTEPPSPPPPTSPPSAVAFPGAEGFGKYATGGRGGAVIEVTNLNDSGPGSLRACTEASVPRTCVFLISGTIAVNTPLTLNSNLTIAGQTAPGGGIQLRVCDACSTARQVITVKGHDIVVRHLRIRPGLNPNVDNRNFTDGVVHVQATNVIWDHVSIAWGNDENIDGYTRNSNITIQWSISAEGLNPHSKGALICSNGNGGCGRWTLHHNLFQSNRDRNPQLSNDAAAGILEFYNNLVYNPISEFVEIWDNESPNWPNSGKATAQIIGNVFKAGPSTNSSIDAIDFHARDTIANNSALVYQDDNLLIGLTALWGPGMLLEYRSAAPLATPTMAIEPAMGIEPRIVAEVGAFPRDTVDARLISEYQNLGGQVPSSQGLVGGWPTLVAGAPQIDVDHDGMPDAWELANGLNPQFSMDCNDDADGDGYTNLEEYLHERHLEVIGTPPLPLPTAGFPAPSIAKVNRPRTMPRMSLSARG